MACVNIGTDEVTVMCGGGSGYTVNLHGATVTSWKNNGEEMLFCSNKAVFDGKKAIRGGIPIVFPNFGPWDLGPQHGFARITRWKVSEECNQEEDGSSNPVFMLEDNEETRQMWNTRFRLEYCVKLASGSLTTSLTVSNKGTDTFSFTTLMHTYFRVDDISKTRIKGLQGLNFVDKVHGGEHTEERDLVNVDENYDRIYKNCLGQVQLFPDIEQAASSRSIVTSNLPDIVVWNPWKDKAKSMSDFGDDEYRNMVCVEAGAVTEPVELHAGKDITFSQTIVVDKNSKM